MTGLLVAFTSAMKRREDGELQEDDSFVVQLADGRVVALDNKGDGTCGAVDGVMRRCKRWRG